MPIQFTTRMMGPIFHVVCEGNVDDAGDACDSYEAALRLCADSGCERMLLDVRAVEGDLTVVDRYQFGTFVASRSTALLIDEDTAIPVALVGNIPLVDVSRFGELVALNRGARVKVTTDVDEAMTWFDLPAPTV